jgi:hypothetical protein
MIIMMRCCITIFISLLLSFSILQAQNPKCYSLDLFKTNVTPPIEDRIFTLEDCVISIEDTTNLGFVLTGFSYKSAPICFKGGFQESIRQFVFSHAFREATKQYQSYVMEIQTLQLNENYSSLTGVESHAELDVQFYIKDSLSQLHPFYKVELFDDNKSREDAVNALLIKALKLLNQYAKAPKNAPGFYSDHEIALKKLIKKYKLPTPARGEVLEKNVASLVKNPSAGVFVSYEELLANKPSIPADFVLPYFVRDSTEVKLFTKNARRIKAKFYAYSNGEELFVNSKLFNQTNNAYKKVFQRGRYLCWADYVYDAGASAATSVGAAIVSGILSGGRMIITSQVNKLVCVVLDIQTGNIFSASNLNMADLLKATPDLQTSYLNASEADKKNPKFHFVLLNNYNLQTNNK